MNAANVMAISPAAGVAGKVQSTGNVGKISKTDMSMPEGSFDEALGKAGEEVTGKMAKSPAESQGSTKENVDAKEADIKDDMPDGTESASLGEQQGKEAKAGKAATKEGEKESAEEQKPGSIAVQAAVLSFTTEGKAALAMEEPNQQVENVMPAVPFSRQVKDTASADDYQRQANSTATLERPLQQVKANTGMNLQSLLPQSGEEAQKNKNFLAMLSGQQVQLSAEKTGNALTAQLFPGQTAAANVPQASTATGNWQQVKTATMLELQLNNHQLANEAAVQGEGIVIAEGLSLNDFQGLKQPPPLADESLRNSPLTKQSILQDTGAESVQIANPALFQNKTQVILPNTYQKMEGENPQTGTQVTGQSLTDEIAGENWQVLNNGREIREAKGMAPFEQSEETMPSMPAGKVNDSAVLQKAEPVIIPAGSVQTANNRKNDTPAANNLLAGVSVTVEEDVPVVTNTTEMQEDFQQGLYRQKQQPAPATELVADEEGEAVSQLFEEAVGDKAPAQPRVVQSANNEPVSMFQQSLNDSLTGTRSSEAVGESQNRQEDFNVPRQIVEQARLLRRGADTQMVIKLHPEHLGELTLKVAVSANGAVNASFHSDNAQVRAIIENSLVQLKQELSNQGLKVDNVDVYAGLTDGQLPQGEGQQAWQQNHGQGSNSHIRNLGNGEDYGEETENIAAGIQDKAEAAEGVDYRI